MIKIKVQGDRVVLKLGKVAKAIKDLKIPFEQIGDLLKQEYTANFPAQGSVLQSPWAPRKHSYPWPLLMNTGTLQAGFEKKAKKTKLTVKNTVEYAKYHHFGMPPQTGARKLVGITARLVEAAKMRIIAYIKKAMAT